MSPDLFSPGLLPEHYLTLQQRVDQWQQPGVRRPSIYEMSKDEKIAPILDAAGIFTTSIGVADADRPMSRTEYLARKGYEQDLNIIAGNLTRALKDTPEFKEAAQTDQFGYNSLGTKLAEMLNTVTSVTAHNVHVAAKKRGDKHSDDTVMADRVVLSVSDLEEERKKRVINEMIVLFGATLVTVGGKVCNVLPAYDETGKIAGIEIRNLNEHMIRSLGRGLEALMAKEDRRKYGTALPNKAPLKILKERGETFHPKIEERLENANRNYKALDLKASYDKSPNMQDITINKRDDYNLLSTDVAGMLQGIRDIFNVRIEELRGGTHRNPEQDPNKKERLRIDDGVNLKRVRATPDQVKDAPLIGRRLSPREIAQDQGREVAIKSRDDPIRSAAEFIDTITSGFNPSSLALTALKNTILLRRGIQRVVEIDNLLSERKKVQDPDYFIRRLSWLANMGGRFNLNYAGRQQLAQLQANTVQEGSGTKPLEK